MTLTADDLNRILEKWIDSAKHPPSDIVFISLSQISCLLKNATKLKLDDDTIKELESLQKANKED